MIELLLLVLLHAYVEISSIYLTFQQQIKNPDIRNGSIFNLLRNDFWGQDIKLVDSHKSFRPVTVLSFRINYSLHGLEPYGYHAVNTIIYGLACFSFWRFTSQWLNADGNDLFYSNSD